LETDARTTSVNCNVNETATARHRNFWLVERRNQEGPQILRGFQAPLLNFLMLFNSALLL
jgi:hypothetical protein